MVYGLLLVILSFSGAAFATEPYIGQFLYQYEGGDTYRVTVLDAENMTWEAISGAEKGASGHEKPQRFKIANQVYFVTWVEKTGIAVTQVINLQSRRVISTIVDGKERYVVQGKIVRE